MANSDQSQHLVLPPPELRMGGPRFLDDEAYVESGRAIARRLSHSAGLTAESRVLDIGCGPGRLLTGLLAEMGSVAEYVGIDVKRSVIDWAVANLAQLDRHIAFRHIDVPNDRYNSEGKADPHRLPIENERFDVIVLVSVFSHMWLRDIEAYCQEIARVLAPGGRVYLTAFTEDDVPHEEENPVDYYREWKGPLHCVRLNRQRFEEIVHDSGLLVHRFEYRHTADGQSSYVLGRIDDPPFEAVVVHA
jgi:SAM-dependent methyltransferase